MKSIHEMQMEIKLVLHELTKKEQNMITAIDKTNVLIDTYLEEVRSYHRDVYISYFASVSAFIMMLVVIYA